MADLLPFIDPVAIGIVLGGTLLAGLFRTPSRDLARALRAVASLGRGAFDAGPLIDQIAALGRIARRHGVVALDRSVIADPDVAVAVAAIVDGASGDEVVLLMTERQRRRALDSGATADFWAGLAEVAPAMGMVGTLVGLVRMFAAMTDPAAIGHAMAVALLSTLYGALLANLIAMPIATRLRRLARHELAERERLIPPLVAMAERAAAPVKARQAA